MPKCEECEYRFKCFTTKDRPKKVKINWEIVHNCTRCTHATTFGYQTHVAYCTKNKYLIHMHSTCDNFEAKSTADVEHVYKELRDGLSQKGKHGLPKYCEDREDG